MDKWDQRYGEPGFAYGTEPNDFLVASLHSLPPSGRVLCLADGEGRNSVFLAEKGYEVTAVDSSSVGMAKAEKLAADRGVTITTCVADLADFQLEDRGYEAIISVFCHLPQPLRMQLHGKIATSLKQGGVFLLEAYSPRQLELGTGGPPTRELLMALGEVRDELRPLAIAHAVELKRNIVEGRLHTGLGAVIQVIAIKR